MRLMPVDTKTAYSEVRFLGNVQPKMGEDDEGREFQKRDDADNLLYTMELLVIEAESGQSDKIKTTVPAVNGKVPGEGLAPFTPVSLIGHRSGAYTDRNGKVQWYYNTASVTAFAVTPAAKAS